MNLFSLAEAAVRKHPDKTALIIDDNMLSYQGLNDLALRYAAMMAGLGVKPGDRVGFFMGNRVELAGLYLACFYLGVVAVPISCYSKAPEVEYQLGHSQAGLFFTEPETHPLVEHLADKLPSLAGIYQVGAEPDRPEAWLPQPAGPLPDAPPSPARPEADAPAVILYTSGSTGASKGVCHTVSSLEHNTINRIAAISHNQDDVYFISSFLCHGSALTSVFLPMLSVGGTTVLMREFTPAAFLECLRRNRPTVVAAAPMQMKALMDEPGACREDFSSIRYLHVGGDAPSLDLFESYRELTGREMGVAMGMTECGGYLLTPPDGPAKPGSMGRPIPGTEVRLLDPDGREVEPGQVGEVTVRTKAMMVGYWHDPENTSAVIKNGWLHSGDLARRDEDGYYFFVGRSKNIIVHDVGNIAPGEVEDVINSHPKVRASGVTGVADGVHGQAVAALVVPVSADDPPTPEELDAFVRQRLADRKVPAKWVFVESIPLTPMSKIDRKALALLAGG